MMDKFEVYNSSNPMASIERRLVCNDDLLYIVPTISDKNNTPKYIRDQVFTYSDIYDCNRDYIFRSKKRVLLVIRDVSKSKVAKILYYLGNQGASVDIYT